MRIDIYTQVRRLCEDLRAVGDRRAHRLGEGGDGPRQEREYSVSTPGGLLNRGVPLTRVARGPRRVRVALTRDAEL